MKKHMFLLIFIFLIANFSFLICQKQGQEKIDSLLQELPKALNDTNHVSLLSALSFEYYSINPDKGIKYGLSGLQLAEELKWKDGIANSMNSIGLCNFSKSNYPKAIDYFFKALTIFEEIGNKSGIARNFGNIGLFYSGQSEYPKALQFYFKSLKMYEELGDKGRISMTLGNIGLIYTYLSDFPKALAFTLKSLQIHTDLGDKSGIANNLGNIGLIYNEQSDYPKALEYYFKSLKMYEELGNKRGILSNLGNLGYLYLILAQDNNYNKVDDKNRTIGPTKDANLRLSIEYSLKAVDICREISDLKSLISLYGNLYEAYKNLDNYPKALEFHEKFKKIQDSVFNSDKTKKISDLESKRASEKQEKELLLIEASNRQMKIIIFSACVLIFLLLALSFFIITERRKSERLLLNVLPVQIARRLKNKENPIADFFDEASVVFIDIVEFTKNSAGVDPKHVVEVLNVLYTKLDGIAHKNGLEKIKTIGDCYMAAAGIPIADPDNSTKAAFFALEAMELLKNYDGGDGTYLNFRCGIDCGNVVAGVIGDNKFIYDVWGDTVNTASRMEEYGIIGKIQCTERFKDVLHLQDVGHLTSFEERGEIEIKGKGMMKTYFLEANNHNILI